MSESKTCAHPGCSCVSTEKYCSQKCADSKNLIELACECGHPGCKGSKIIA